MSTSNGGWDFSGYTPPASSSGGSFGAPAQGFGSGVGSDPAFGSGAGAPSAFGAPPQSPLQAQPTAQPGPSPFGGPAPTTFGGGFGTAGGVGGAPEPLGTVAPPTGWLIAAVGLALVAGIVASIFGGVPAVAIVCWAVAGPVVIGLLAVYLTRDIRARAHLTYSPPTWGPLLYGVALGVTFIAVMIASLQIAFWVGRLG